jgi:hypothetical protein
VAGPHEILLGVFNTASEVTHSFLLRGRRMNLREESRAEKLTQLPSIPTVSLDAIPRPTRDQRRSHDHAP